LAGFVPPVATEKLTVEEWQLSHGVEPADVWVGLVFWLTGVIPTAKVFGAPMNPWQVAQPLTMPVCFIIVPENDVKLLAEWQVSHAMLVGR
jgi:hypothetical protein